jgi:hypothetical protein
MDEWLHPPPVAEAVEGGESMWDLWQETARRLDQAFAPTQPSSQVPLVDDDESPPATQALSVDTLMVMARRNNRVCPRPAAWTRLYEELGGNRYVDLQPPPVQSWNWTKLSRLQKRLHLRAHIEWADRHGKLPVVAGFFQELAEQDWVHMADS